MMAFKIALFVLAQVFYASASCSIDACLFKTCGADVDCCEKAVKGLCDLSQLQNGLDPVFIPKCVNHTVADNFKLEHVVVRGIRGQDSYSQYACTADGFTVDLSYDKLEINGNIHSRRNQGAYHGVARGFNARAQLTLTYSAGKPTVQVALINRAPTLASYTFSVSGKETRKQIDNAEAVNFVAVLLHDIFVKNYERVFTVNSCQ